MNRVCAVVLFFLVLGSEPALTDGKGDIHFSNASVYTVNVQQPLAQSVVTDGASILYVGDEQGAKAYVGPDTKVIDLEGRLMLPGFNDTHIHLFIGAALGSGLAVSMSDSLEQSAQKIKEFAEANPDKKTIFASGINTALSVPGTDVKSVLDAAVPDRPVYMLDSTMHNGYANSKSLEIAGVDRSTPDVTGGTYVRDAKGDATGLIQGTPAQIPVVDAVGAIDPVAVARILPQLVHEMNKMGLTGAIDYGNPLSTEATYKAAMIADLAGDLNLRLSINYYVNTEALAKDAIDKMDYFAQLIKSPHTKVDTLKLLVDGIADNRKAALLEPYEGTEENGTLNLSIDTLNQLVMNAAQKGYNVTGHVVGDRAARVLLDAFEAARKSGFTDNIFSTSHTTFVDPEDIPRFRELNVIVQATGNWATRKANYPALIGHKRNETFQMPLRSWEDDGVTLAFGSDWPATDGGFEYGVNPFMSIYAAMHRRHQTEFLEVMAAEPEALPPLNEVLTLTEAIEAYTLNAAKLAGTENITGSIEPGKMADLIVLDRDLFNVEHSEIPSTKVLMTVMGGKIVYQADDS